MQFLDDSVQKQRKLVDGNRIYNFCRLKKPGKAILKLLNRKQNKQIDMVTKWYLEAILKDIESEKNVFSKVNKQTMRKISRWVYR
jgi:hypothetical protein